MNLGRTTENAAAATRHAVPVEPATETTSISRGRTIRRRRSGRCWRGGRAAGSPPGPNAWSGGIVMTRRPPMRIPSTPAMIPGIESPSTSSIKNGSPLSQVLYRIASVVARTSSMWTTACTPGRDRLAGADDDVDDRQLGRPDGGLEGDVGRRVGRVRGAESPHAPRSRTSTRRRVGSPTRLVGCRRTRARRARRVGAASRPGSRSAPAPIRRSTRPWPRGKSYGMPRS